MLTTLTNKKSDLSKIRSRTRWRITKRPDGENWPLSFAQERLWFLHRLDPDSDDYNELLTIRFVGQFNYLALLKSIQEIVRRHESLRTIFTMGPEGMAIQSVLPSLKLKLPAISLESLTDSQQECVRKMSLTTASGVRFDLARGPLVRIMLLRLNPKLHETRDYHASHRL